MKILDLLDQASEIKKDLEDFKFLIELIKENDRYKGESQTSNVQQNTYKPKKQFVIYEFNDHERFLAILRRKGMKCLL